MHPKALVETVGSRQYMDLTTDTLLRHDRPTLVEVSPYVAQLVSRALVTVIRSNLNEAMTDEGFVERLASTDGDHEFAVDAYLSEFDAPAEDAKDDGKQKSDTTDQKRASQTNKPVGK